MSEKPPPMPGKGPPPMPRPPEPPATEKLPPAEPPTRKQLDYIAALGGDPERVHDRRAASRSIDLLKGGARPGGPTNRQLALLAFLGYPPEVMGWTMEEAKRCLDREVTREIRAAWTACKRARRAQGFDDVPADMAADPRASWEEMEEWREALFGKPRRGCVATGAKILLGVIVFLLVLWAVITLGQ